MDASLFDFPDVIAALHTTAAVGAALLRHMRPLGIETYVIGALPAHNSSYPPTFTLDNLPPGSWENYAANDMARHDPALRAIMVSGAPVTYREIRTGAAGFPPTPAELAVLNFCAPAGSTEGLVVPIFRAQGYRGIAALLGPGPDPQGAVRAALRFLAEHAHDRMRALFAPSKQTQGPTLSSREIELMVLAQRGLNDEEIAAATGIAVRTVRFHFENVRRKVGARNRAEAIATAINLHLLLR